jgi:hypothetical protein
MFGLLSAGVFFMLRTFKVIKYEKQDKLFALIAKFTLLGIGALSLLVTIFTIIFASQNSYDDGFGYTYKVRVGAGPILMVLFIGGAWVFKQFFADKINWDKIGAKPQKAAGAESGSNATEKVEEPKEADTTEKAESEE